VQIKTLIRSLLLVVFFIPFLSYGQDRCGTVEQFKKNPSKTSEAVFEQWLNKKIKNRRLNSAGRILATRKIPVVVHIIHKGEALGAGTNIPDEQVFSQISVLNKDYQRLNDDAVNTPALFEPFASSMDVEFALARRTPEGLPTNGIVRVAGPPTRNWSSSDDAEFKALSYWDSNKYLNIWVIDITDYLGYSQFPISDLPGLEGSPDAPLTDGIVIHPSVFGSDDDGDFDLDEDYNKGRTTTHEIGHFLGLRHTWGDDGGSCMNNGGGSDYVNDTPDQEDNSVGCPNHPKTNCGGVVVMFQNYMDYTDDACMNLFTIDQVERMNTVLESSPRRVSLLSSDGLDDPDPVTTENLTVKSIAAPVVTCQSISDLTVRIKNNGVEVTTFTARVNVNGAISELTPVDPLAFSTSDEMDFIIPSIVMKQGENKLTVEITEPNGNEDSFPADNAVSFKVIVDEERDLLPVKLNFEQGYSQWTITNPFLGMEWAEIETNHGTSLYFNGFGNQANGDRAWLVSPDLDFSELEEASLGFYVSYAFRSGTADNLKVYASTDCGQNFDVILYNETGGSITGDDSNAKWKPEENDQWERKLVSLESLLGEPNVRIAFVFTNTNGNNIYLDNIDLFTTDNPIEAHGEDVLQVFPNGVRGPAPSLRLNLPQKEDVQIEVINSTGQRIRNFTLVDALNQTVDLGLQVDPVGESSVYTAMQGLYFVRVTSPTKSYVEKFMVVH
jgi:hypothetical protein